MSGRLDAVAAMKAADAISKSETTAVTDAIAWLHGHGFWEVPSASSQKFVNPFLSICDIPFGATLECSHLMDCSMRWLCALPDRDSDTWLHQMTRSIVSKFGTFRVDVLPPFFSDGFDFNPAMSRVAMLALSFSEWLKEMRVGNYEHPSVAMEVYCECIATAVERLGAELSARPAEWWDEGYLETKGDAK